MPTTSLKSFNAKAKRLKEKLAKKASKHGICENFGQNEIRELCKIKDDYLMSPMSSIENATLMMMVCKEFIDWVESFELQVLI